MNEGVSRGKEAVQQDSLSPFQGEDSGENGSVGKAHTASWSCCWWYPNSIKELAIICVLGRVGVKGDCEDYRRADRI
jgi:hypothetical protein